MSAPLRILHLHSTFDLGGKEARAVRLMNLWGGRARHTIVSGDHTAMAARAAVGEGIDCAFPMEAAPPLKGRPSAGRCLALARYMAGFDLVLTYNWGAMDAVMARRLCAPFTRLPPIVHHEDGFNLDEAARLKPLRNLYRRIALPAATALVVPSARLHEVARSSWGQPRHRIHEIANGVDVEAFSRAADSGAIPGFVPTPGVVVGTVAGLRPVKNLALLVRAVAATRQVVDLVIVGEGPDRDALTQEAARCGVALHLPGYLPDPARYLGLFDIFALSSDSEQFPIALVEAMAAGRPAVCTRVGDVAGMISDENRPFLAAPGDEAAFSQALFALLSDEALRLRVGNANREKARANYREDRMVARYAALYEAAVGRPGALSGAAAPDD